MLNYQSTVLLIIALIILSPVLISIALIIKGVLVGVTKFEKYALYSRLATVGFSLYAAEYIFQHGIMPKLAIIGYALSGTISTLLLVRIRKRSN